MLPYKDFSSPDITLDEVLDTDDYVDYGNWVVCDLEKTNDCKHKTTNFQLIPLRREVENNEIGYKQRLTSSSKSEKLKLDHSIQYTIEC